MISINFKNYKLFAAAMLLTLLFSCKKDNPYGEGFGNITVWVQDEIGCGYIDVDIDGIPIGTITQSMGTSSVECCEQGTVCKVCSVGEHVIHAKGTIKGEWQNTVNVRNGKCHTFKITYKDNTNYNACNKYSLNGSWTRQSSGGTNNELLGMVVYVSGSTGTISSVGSNTKGFASGQTKWQNIDFNNCNMDELEMPSGDYSSSSLGFVSENEISVSGVKYTR